MRLVERRVRRLPFRSTSMTRLHCSATSSATRAPLPDRKRAVLDKPLPPPRPLARQDEADALRESIAAPLSFQDRLDVGDKSVHLRDGIPRVLTDLRRGRWVVQDQLDLHGLTRDTARGALSAFLAHALEQATAASGSSTAGPRFAGPRTRAQAPLARLADAARGNPRLLPGQAARRRRRRC